MRKTANPVHSDNVLKVNRVKLELEDSVKSRKAVGYSIHQLIKARNNVETEYEKQEYTNVIDTLYDLVYKPLTDTIFEDMYTIKSSKQWAKKSQQNYDKYNWLRYRTRIRFKRNQEIKDGLIISPFNVQEYTDNLVKYDFCWICVIPLGVKKTFFGKTKEVEELVTSVSLDEIIGYYNCDNYIELK
jgi:hypothetical protein